MTEEKKLSDSLELIPIVQVQRAEETLATPVPPPPSPSPPATAQKVDDSSGFAVFSLIVGALLLIALIITGAISAFDWILGTSLKTIFLTAPLKVASYLFLTIISILAGMEVSGLLTAQKNKAIRRSYVFSLLVAGMLSYGIFYLHLTLEVRLPDSMAFVFIGTVVGTIAGWILPSIVDEEPYGTLSYLMLLVILIAFTWLARFEALPSYGWSAFAAMIAYFLRSAIIGIKRAMSKRDSTRISSSQEGKPEKMGSSKA